MRYKNSIVDMKHICIELGRIVDNYINIYANSEKRAGKNNFVCICSFSFTRICRYLQKKKKTGRIIIFINNLIYNRTKIKQIDRKLTRYVKMLLNFNNLDN